eukprot:scaffold24993_cov185-Isochrysis_galbana.AAC.1
MMYTGDTRKVLPTANNANAALAASSIRAVIRACVWEYKLSGGALFSPVGPTLPVRARKLPHAAAGGGGGDGEEGDQWIGQGSQRGGVDRSCGSRGRGQAKRKGTKKGDGSCGGVASAVFSIFFL